MSRGLGRVERAILEVVQMPEFAAPRPPKPEDGLYKSDPEAYYEAHHGHEDSGSYVVGVPIGLLALYVANCDPGAHLQRLPTHAEYMEMWRATGAGTGSVYRNRAQWISPPSRSVDSSTRRAVGHLRRLGVVATSHGYGDTMRVTRPPTDEEEAARRARVEAAMAGLAAMRR